MAWPVSPTNGQQTTIANVLYEYNSTRGAWTKVQLAQPPYISDGNNVTISGNLTIPGTMSAASFSVANVSVGNITASGTITATGFVGPVTGNLTGTASNASFATLAATANTVAGANVTGQVPYAAIANSVNGGNVIGQVSFAAVANSVAGANVSGTVSTATTASVAGTVTTAAQPNITSVGSLTSLTIAANGDINMSGTGSNINGVALVSATLFAGSGANLTNLNGSNISSGTIAAARIATLNQNTTGYAATVSNAAQPNITSVGTLTSLAISGTNDLTVRSITTGANTTAGTITGNWTLSTGSRLQATYADLAEYYEADQPYEPGTVLEFGGEKEVTLATDETKRVAGVVSTDPAYVMNSTCLGHAVALALQGRVPCKVRGIIKKGDMLVSGGNGFARPTHDPKLGTIIGKALEEHSGGEGVIEVAVGRL
jgi:hypothetical protein